MLTPKTEEAVAEAVRGAIAKKLPLAIQGGGTRKGLGRPVQAGDMLSLEKLAGVTLHEPAEMVISALAGTPLSVVEKTLASKGQMLPFEPMDHRAIFGTSGEPTIGAVVAANVSGPRRVVVGACRDHLIGVRFVNGAGEIIKSGGRVMKNVTGLDLVKLQAGAHGTLGVLTEVTFKVLPRPEASASMVFDGLPDGEAVAAMSAALGSPFEVSGAAHLPAGVAGESAQTLLRFENFTASIDYRFKALAAMLKRFGNPRRIDGSASEKLWVDIRDCQLLATPRETALWRLSVKPSDAPRVADIIRNGLTDAKLFYDWGGGLIWLATASVKDAGATVIRAAVKGKGHATLVRASDSIRISVPVFEPESAPVAMLSRRIKSSFDPAGLINPGRMIAEA
ncbi:MAG: glycolate oxidase subunit GlcE [Rhizobiales bacterium]|nr:glycolate oxidase subunit GlcE [Hyphomicrobiales bacterium]